MVHAVRATDHHSRWRSGSAFLPAREIAQQRYTLARE
jgi:hypothetical protein